jgi:Putative peptidoglycan binding domain
MVNPTIKKGSTGTGCGRLRRTSPCASTIPAQWTASSARRPESATKWYQSDHGLKADGIIGPNTWKELDPPTIKKGSSGDSVRMLQQLLKDWGYNPGAVDGTFGTKTEQAVKQFQTDLTSRGRRHCRTHHLGDARKLSPDERAPDAVAHGGDHVGRRSSSEPDADRSRARTCLTSPPPRGATSNRLRSRHHCQAR